MREASIRRTVTDTDSYAFLVSTTKANERMTAALKRLMTYKRQKEFLEELAAEFDVNKDTFRCYTLESSPQFKVILFGRQEWDSCHIGFLINKHFHVLGLGSFSCINEDAKALYIAGICTFPQNEQKLKVYEHSLFDEEEQVEIINKFKQIFPKK